MQSDLQILSFIIVLNTQVKIRERSEIKWLTRKQETWGKWPSEAETGLADEFSNSIPFTILLFGRT